VVVACSLLLAGVAAAAGPVVTAGTPPANQPPSVAVDAAGDAIVAWNNNASGGNAVQYCVIPTGATACSHSGSLLPADGPAAIDGVNVLADGSTMVILADVFGTQGTSAGHYQPEQEWQSTDGGATFNVVNAGLSVASASFNADTGPLNAVIVPGTNVLGFGWDTPGYPPSFNAFPLVSPPECSKASPCQFAVLQPLSDPQPLGNGGGKFAAEAGAHPGVLGVFSTIASSGPLGCSGSTPDGIAFAFGSGNQGAGNSYNLSPGSAGSAWTGPAALAECGVKLFAVGGGPSGFGILADNEANGHTVYQQFDQTTKKFGAMVSVADQGEIFPALSQDAAGGVYATYLAGGTGGPVALSYSPDGGKTWAGPAQLQPFNSQDHVTSSVNGAGQGWAAWNSSGAVFAEAFTAADAAGPPVVGSNGSSNGKTITVTVTCSAFPCTVTITISGPPSAAADVARKHKHRKPAVLARARFTISSAGPHKLTLRLTRAGKHFFKSHHRTVRVKGKVVQTFKGKTTSKTKTLRIRIKSKRHRKK
jgi:hypothetical protein